MSTPAPRRGSFTIFGAGASVGLLGGLIGLGGAEFRLPLLLGWFRFGPLDAIVLNKATSLVVVAAALVFRTRSFPLDEVMAHSGVLFNLLAGSLIGAWLGAGWATRLSHTRLHQVIAVLLVVIALVLVSHGVMLIESPTLQPAVRITFGVLAGFGIGLVAALLGVAGGELLIPTLVVLFGVEIKLAGSLSLAVSLPTMVVSLMRYRREARLGVLVRERLFFAIIAAGSITGAFVGALLLGSVPGALLYPLLGLLLLASALKMCRSV